MIMNGYYSVDTFFYIIFYYILFKMKVVVIAMEEQIQKPPSESGNSHTSLMSGFKITEPITEEPAMT